MWLKRKQFDSILTQKSTLVSSSIYKIVNGTLITLVIFPSVQTAIGTFQKGLNILVGCRLDISIVPSFLQLQLFKRGAFQIILLYTPCKQRVQVRIQMIESCGTRVRDRRKKPKKIPLQVIQFEAVRRHLQKVFQILLVVRSCPSSEFLWSLVGNEFLNYIMYFLFSEHYLLS